MSEVQSLRDGKRPEETSDCFGKSLMLSESRFIGMDRIQTAEFDNTTAVLECDCFYRFPLATPRPGSRDGDSALFKSSALWKSSRE